MQRELLEEHRALTPRAGLADRVAAVVVAERRLGRRSPAGEVGLREQPAVPATGRVQDLGGAGEAHDRLREPALVEGGAGVLDLPVAVARRSLGLAHDPGVGLRERGVAHPPAGARRGQPQLPRAGPLALEQVRHALDRGDDPPERRKPAAGVLDRMGEHVAEAQRAVLEQHQQPRAERAGHARRQQARAGHDVEAQLVAQQLHAGRRGRDALAAEHERLAALGRPRDRRHVPARTVEMRLHDLQDEAGGDRGVERVAAALEHGHPRPGGQPVRRGHHPEAARQLRPGGEAHRPPPSSTPSSVRMRRRIATEEA